MSYSTVIERIDQRSIQKYGGDFARYPSSFVVCKLLRQYGLKRVLDVTYIFVATINQYLDYILKKIG